MAVISGDKQIVIISSLTDQKGTDQKSRKESLTLCQHTIASKKAIKSSF